MQHKGVWISLAAAALAIVVWQVASSRDEALAAPFVNTASSAAQSAVASSEGGTGGEITRAPFAQGAEQSRQQQLVLWQARYARATQVYESYKQATRYPHESRPIEEHPDQVRPFSPISEENVLRDATNKAVKGVRLRTTQTRVFLSGAESVTFSISAADENGTSLPVLVTRATAQNLPETKTLISLTQTAVDFADGGNGVLSATLTPAQQGFAKVDGTIRLLAQVSVNGEQGVAHFDVIYTPEVPALWAGAREALEHGSLNFYLKARVLKAGRYVVSARVDDANGKPFALLQFNDEVAAGEREFKLNLFGALVRDRTPAFPLKLRDVEGFVLYPDRFPDRAMMARQSGVVLVSGSYALDRFSPEEWTSEERDRYLAEYDSDVARARERLTHLQ